MVGIEAVGHQVQLTAVELRGQLEARHRGDAVLLQRGRETSGPLDRVVVGQRGIADTTGCQRGRQRLRRLLAVAEDGVGVEVDVRRVAANGRIPAGEPSASGCIAARGHRASRFVGASREVAEWPRHGRRYAVAGSRFWVRSETTISVTKLNGMETMPGLVSGNGASSGSSP